MAKTELTIPGLSEYVESVKDRITNLFGTGVDADLVKAMIENAYISGMLKEQELMLEKFNEMTK